MANLEHLLESGMLTYMGPNLLTPLSIYRYGRFAPPLPLSPSSLRVLQLSQSFIVGNSLRMLFLFFLIQELLIILNMQWIRGPFRF